MPVHSSVVGCANGEYRLSIWRKEICPLHNINFGVAHCICDLPFKLFPSEKKDEKGRQNWSKLGCN
jgi:hypothetical protein